MKINEAVGNRILELCQQYNITPNKLATISCINPSTITSIFYGKSKNPSILTILYICTGLNITIYDFFNSEIFKTNNFDL